MGYFQETGEKFYCVKDKTFARSFPPTEKAIHDPDGLLAVGGSLSVNNLLEAYKRGIFPWYTEGSPVMWWSPHIRPVIKPNNIKISRSLRKTIKKNTFIVSYDKCFERVMRNCSNSRGRAGNSWITAEMVQAYAELHRSGYAHSVECWRNGRLTGGLYGVVIGRVFYGESMFSIESNASKVALADLCDNLDFWGYGIIDCQVPSPHLSSLGAELIDRKKFEAILSENIGKKPTMDAWKNC